MTRTGFRSLFAASTVLLAIAMATACGPGEAPCMEEGLTRVRFDPRSRPGADWLSHPFPSDHRASDGRLDLFDFPNPGGSELVETYLIESEDVLHGFGLNTPIYFSFDGPIDPSSLPEDPGAFLVADSPVQLLDVDPASPELGRRFPLRWRYNQEGDSFWPADTLAVAPLWGFPLRDATTYAVVLTRDLRDEAGARLAPTPLLGTALCEDERCVSEMPAAVVESTRARLAPLRDLLRSEGADLGGLAAATVFTTQDATFDVRKMRETIQNLAAPSVTDWRTFDTGKSWYERRFQWIPGQEVPYYVLEGAFVSPYFLEGRIPYSTHADGGGIRIENGLPAIVRNETLRFALTIPAAPPRSGACYPMVQYAHGTGGDAYGFTYSSAGRLAGRGLAGIGLDQPLHGIRNDGRSYDVSLLTFNINNIHSTRSVFRQSAADTFSLTRMLKNGFEVPAEVSPTGQRICFDSDRLLFLGHSQGGITGAIAAGFEPDVNAWMLSGAGGGVSITLVERKDPLDVASLLALLGGLRQGEEVDEFHPLVALVHTLTEVTDPLNYSPRWLLPDGSRHFLVTSGSEDTATPYKTALAKTAAAGIPLVRPAGTDADWHELAGAPPIFDPVSENAGGATAGHIHFPGGDHFVIFHLREAINASMRFLETAATGTPVIVRDPNALVR